MRYVKVSWWDKIKTIYERIIEIVEESKWAARRMLLFDWVHFNNLFIFFVFFNNLNYIRLVSYLLFVQKKVALWWIKFYNINKHKLGNNYIINILLLKYKYCFYLWYFLFIKVQDYLFFLLSLFFEQKKILIKISRFFFCFLNL